MSKLKPEEQLYIYNQYLGDFEIGVPIMSPIRDEGTPSFSVFETFDGDFKWRDFGYSDAADDVVEFVRLYHMQNDGWDGSYAKVFRKIRDILNGVEDIEPIIIKKTKNKVTLNVKVKKFFDDFELSYWRQRNIDEKILGRDLTFPLKALEVKGHKVTESIPGDPKFVYLYKTWDNRVIPDCWKVYSPLNENKKWITHNTYKAAFETLPQLNSDRLCILSSRKDKQVFDSLGFNFDTTNPISEGNFRGLLQDKNIMNYREKYVLFDFDSSETSKKGVERTKQLEEESGGKIKGIYLKDDLRNFLISNGVKDIDEAVIKFGVNKTKDLIIKIWNDQELTI